MENISKLHEITPKNVDWVAFGARVQAFRERKNLNIEAAAAELRLTFSQLSRIENGNKSSKTVNVIWQVSQLWNLSLNWLLNGTGSFHDEDPIDLVPETLIIEKRSGVRQNTVRHDAEEGAYGDQMFEFVMAVQKYKSQNKINFPSWTEIYDIFQALGYRKTAPARIAPLKCLGALAQDK